MQHSSKLYFRLLQLATVGVFLGRGWQHLYWDAPYRELLWDERWMKGIVEHVLGMSWQAYVSSPAVNAYIQAWIDGTGVFYLLCALAAAALPRLGKPARWMMYLGAGSLLLLSALYCKEKFFFIGQFFEYSLQFSSPVFLVLLSRQPDTQPNARLLLAIKIAVALTFTCHGLYAIGYYPRPGHFVYMTMSILGVGDAGAATFLQAAGLLDFLLSVLLFVPGRASLYAAGYAVFWGLATTMARPWAALYSSSLQQTMVQWVHEAVLRFPHFLVPLLVALYLWNKQKRKASKAPAPEPLGPRREWST